MDHRIVYPISANPPTWGHADIMARGAQKFSRLYWAMGKKPGKIPPVQRPAKATNVGSLCETLQVEERGN